jgi:alkanesulfonate monooxygenase
MAIEMIGMVGTPRQVAEALMAYRRAGAGTVLNRGFDHLGDVVQCGQEPVPLRHELAVRTLAGLGLPVAEHA